MRLRTNCPQGNKFNVTFCIFPFARLDAVEKHVKWMSILLSLGLHHDLSKHQRPRVEPGVSYIAEWSPWPDLQQLQWKLPTTILDLIISIPSVNSTTTGQRRRLWAQDAHHDNAAAHWHPRRQTPIGGEGRSTFVMGGGGGPNGASGLESGQEARALSRLSARGVKQGILPLHSLFFPRPLGWRLATSADDETGEDSESPTVQRMGGGREEKSVAWWISGFSHLQVPLFFARIPSRPALRRAIDSTASFTGASLHLYAPPFWVLLRHGNRSFAA